MSSGSPHNYPSACVTTEGLDQCHSFHANERIAYLMNFWILINLTVASLYFKRCIYPTRLYYK